MIELSPFCDYKLDFTRGNLKTSFSEKPSKREFQSIRLEGQGNLKCQVEFIGSIKEIIIRLKQGNSVG
jgi:hypothetical protein